MNSGWSQGDQIRSSCYQPGERYPTPWGRPPRRRRSPYALLCPILAPHLEPTVSWPSIDPQPIPISRTRLPQSDSSKSNLEFAASGGFTPSFIGTPRTHHTHMSNALLELCGRGVHTLDKCSGSYLLSPGRQSGRTRHHHGIFEPHQPCTPPPKLHKYTRHDRTRGILADLPLSIPASHPTSTATMPTDPHLCYSQNPAPSQNITTPSTDITPSSCPG